MRGYEIKFQIYAESENEAILAQQAIIGFISRQAQSGRAVTGQKIVKALESCENNVFIKNQVNNFLR